ncbi:MAG: DUF192 domain-containing protein, partial [Acidimicrobiales bacterium]
MAARDHVLMAWLLRGDQVLASVEVVAGFTARSKGLLGRKGIDGAMLLRRTNGVHSIGMRFDMDVAWLDKDLAVLKVVRLRRLGIALP